MNTTVDTSRLEALGLMSKPSASKSQDTSGQGDFIKLMLTQLQNQDPLKPMQSGEFLTQMAQFGTVSGIKDLKEMFSQFAQSMHSNQALQASSLLGHTVVVPNSNGYLPASGNMSGVVDLPESTGSLTVNIYDQGGQLVRKLDLGTQTAGRVNFSWNGIADDGKPAAPGTYVLKAVSAVGEKSTENQILAESTISSVLLDKNSGDFILNLAGGLGSVKFSDVKEIR